MSLLPSVTLASSVIVARARERVRGVGDANSSRTLDGECEGDGEFRRSAQGDRRRAALSQIGTGSSAPFWNGPRLQPAFVAQVLGQVMTDRQKQTLNPAPAYRRQTAQIPNGAFFNDDV
ncbi:MAG TPA: hypothetical protein VII56_20150 [Rhizomicrobium sp.]